MHGVFLKEKSDLVETLSGLNKILDNNGEVLPPKKPANSKG